MFKDGRFMRGPLREEGGWGDNEELQYSRSRIAVATNPTGLPRAFAARVRPIVVNRGDSWYLRDIPERQ